MGSAPLAPSGGLWAGPASARTVAAARGVTLLAAGARSAGPIGTVHMPEVRAEAPGVLERGRQALGAGGYVAAWAAGQAMRLDEAVAYAREDARAAPATA